MSGKPSASTREHAEQSCQREAAIKHLLLGEILRRLWRRDVEVLNAEVDDSGYDLAMRCNGILRYIQLKTTRRVRPSAP